MARIAGEDQPNELLGLPEVALLGERGCTRQKRRGLRRD